ncbi:FKBP-type peptidyl-prolyl cis-trans isomerase [Nesterenkonia flava]|uniref:peptidylprolyl isomerase n=1 Tax=Nesterenkonia flava TaxID=469799 RepID=A0ABU1FPW1_9MICC|nr:FKBP-type peptidyl-prolyl cis-trans isomerase [Nesterenkonia flava]MDR5710682.1 FKBP-type peptidyl-prolyl cis-trans isomerase [Nesterenkonia flava]
MNSPAKLTALTAALALMLTACGGNDDTDNDTPDEVEGSESQPQREDATGEGFGDTSALSEVDVNMSDEQNPEVMVYSPLEVDEESAYVVNQGEGDEIHPNAILEVSSAAVDPEDGNIIQHDYDSGQSGLVFLPSLEGDDANTAIYDALTLPELRVGADVLIYAPAEEPEETDEDTPEELQMPSQDQFILLTIEEQTMPHAEGEVQEQSGDLPAIENTVGERPQLQEHDGDTEAPEELATEVLIQGEGREVEESDMVLAHYTGWRWEDGEVFDDSWESEDGSFPQPREFSLQQVIGGWTEGLAGQNVGSRVLLVIPAEDAYGEAENEDGTTADGRPGGALIFVVDIVEALPMPEQPQQQAPEMDLSEEEMAELEEMLREMEEQQGGNPEAENENPEPESNEE